MECFTDLERLLSLMALKGLNPYYNGMYYRLAFVSQAVNAQSVLILIIMECITDILFFKQLQNPAFSFILIHM